MLTELPLSQKSLTTSVANTDLHHAIKVTVIDLNILTKKKNVVQIVWKKFCLLFIHDLTSYSKKSVEVRTAYQQYLTNINYIYEKATNTINK